MLTRLGNVFCNWLVAARSGRISLVRRTMRLADGVRNVPQLIPSLSTDRQNKRVAGTEVVERFNELTLFDPAPEYAAAL